MKCTGATIETFSYDLTQPLVVGKNTMTSREGLWVWLKDDEGRVGRGEVAPLPGVSLETLDEAQAQLADLLPQLTESSLFELNTKGLAPSVQLGLDMAMTELIWQSQSQSPVPAWTGRAVALNGLVMAHEGDVETAVAGLVAEGYKSIKIKVGRQFVDEDIATVRAVLKRLPEDVSLRLDANRRWTLDQAEAFGLGVGRQQIEYIEEPCADLDDQETFYQRTLIPLALDESLLTLTPETITEIEGLAALILKPALLGPWYQSLMWVTRTQGTDVSIVFSSIFESPHALNFYARCACQCRIFDVPQGLDTWRWLQGADQELNVQRGAIVFAGGCGGGCQCGDIANN